MESDSGILEPPRLARGVDAVGQQAVPTILARVHDQAGAGESGVAESAGARPRTEVGALLPGPPAERSTVDAPPHCAVGLRREQDRNSTRLNSSHVAISYAVFCLK